MREVSCTLECPVSGLPLMITHTSSRVGRLIVIRMPAMTFWMIWRDENATTIPGMPGDVAKVHRSKAGR